MTAGAPVTITEPLRKLHQARRRSFVQSVSPLQPPPHKHLYRLLNSPSTAANFVAVSFVPQNLALFSLEFSIGVVHFRFGGNALNDSVFRFYMLLPAIRIAIYEDTLFHLEHGV